MKLGKPSEPATDEVVDAPVAEQQAVRGLVHERRELRVRASHRAGTRRPTRTDCRATRRPRRCRSSARRPTATETALRSDRDAAQRRRAAPGPGRPSARRRSPCTGREQRRVGHHRGRACVPHSRAISPCYTIGTRDCNHVIVRGGSDRRPGRCRARSLMASLLLGMERPERSAAELVRWCALFGVRRGTARVAMSRMVDAGRAARRRGPLRARRTGAGPRPPSTSVARRRAAAAAWDGVWVVAVVTADARASDERGGAAAPSCAGRTTPSSARACGRGPTTSTSRAGGRARRAVPDLACASPTTTPRSSRAGAVRARRRGTPLRPSSPCASATPPRPLRDRDGRRRRARRRVPRRRRRARASSRRSAAAARTVAAPTGPATRLRAAYDEFQPAFDRAVAAWFRASA